MRLQTFRAPSLIGLLLFVGLGACRPAPYEPDSVETETSPAPTAEAPMPDPGQEPSRLAVLWTSGDPEVAVKVTFMYTLNAKARGWWDHVALIVWGPSSRLLAENEALQAEVQAMGEAGVELLACKACADSYGVSEALEALGIEVKYMGVPLTEMLKSDEWEVITF